MNTTTEQSKDQLRNRRNLAVLRWVLLLPAVATTFITTAVVSGGICLILDFEDGLFLLVPPMCASVWILTVYLIAPSHKKTAGVIAYIAGLAALWALTSSAPSRDPSGTWAMITAGTVGLLVLLICMAPQLRRCLIDLFRHGFSSDNRTHIKSILQQLIQKGENIMNEQHVSARQFLRRHRWARLLIVLVCLFIGGSIAMKTARGFVDIVPQERKGLHMRLGRYIQTLDPGLHFKLPVIDRVIGVSVREKQGYIKHVDAMTEDNVIMKVSLQYTYEVTDPRRYRLEVEEPDAIIKEFVQGKLRDIVNTISMSDVMKKRMELNQRITEGLDHKAKDYGIRFKLVQVQGAYPPPEVQEAIKQRMVTEQRTVAAREQATQTHIIADAALYEAQQQTQAAKYQIEETAKARKESIRLLLEELSKHEALGPQYLEYLTAQELKDNSKWIIAGNQAPQLHLEAE
jgi:regulator of protease activity HflC (stomatin/prohibitin superfamily)